MRAETTRVMKTLENLFRLALELAISSGNAPHRLELDVHGKILELFIYVLRSNMLVAS